MKLHLSHVAILALVLALSLVSTQANAYCNLCKDHTMCIYGSPGKSCKAFGSGGVSAAEKTYIVDMHNWYRRQVAVGNEKRGVGGAQPKAANMRKMYWDNGLAAVAQRWADQCIWGHDACRKDQRFSWVGQNAYMEQGASGVNWKAAMGAWYNEVAKFNPKTVNSYQFNAAIGHYSQMVWHETYLVGCARRDYSNRKMYVCNYAPGGNILTRPVYLQGQPCTRCPSGTRCSNYLCEIAPRLFEPAGISDSAEQVPAPEWNTTSEEVQAAAYETPVFLPPTFLDDSSSDDVASAGQAEDPSSNEV